MIFVYAILLTPLDRPGHLWLLEGTVLSVSKKMVSTLVDQHVPLRPTLRLNTLNDLASWGHLGAHQCDCECS